VQMDHPRVGWAVRRNRAAGYPWLRVAPVGPAAPSVQVEGVQAGQQRAAPEQVVVAAAPVVPKSKVVTDRQSVEPRAVPSVVVVVGVRVPAGTAGQQSRDWEPWRRRHPREKTQPDTREEPSSHFRET